MTYEGVLLFEDAEFGIWAWIVFLATSINPNFKILKNSKKDNSNSNDLNYKEIDEKIEKNKKYKNKIKDIDDEFS